MNMDKLKTLKASLIALGKEVTDINIQGGTSAITVATLEFQQQAQQ